MMDRYLPGIMLVNYAGQSPVEALAHVEAALTPAAQSRPAPDTNTDTEDTNEDTDTNEEAP
jgi:hypothetical protein